MNALREWFRGPGQLQAMRAETDNLRAKVEFQALVIEDITTVTDRDKKYKGNAYQTYDEAIAELALKYEGEADWGVLQTGNIIDIRSAFITAGGLKAYPSDKKTDPAENEMEFIGDFFEFNNLDREMVQEFAKEAELEGRFLGEMFWDNEAGMVALRYRSWGDLHYKVQTDAKDYSKYTGITWTKDSKPMKLEPGAFVYGRFGGRVHKPDSPYPKCAKCLTQIDYLDAAIRDWREINRLFAAPVPDFEFADADQAQKAATAIDKINWKTKKAISHTGTFSFKAPDMAGTQSLENEIITLSKMISGTTGVPVHFLGLPDLMSNRATADNLMELVSASTNRERSIWKGVYQSIITKAMAIWNEQSQKTQLDPTLLTVDIPYITQETWTKIKDVYLPLYNSSAISLQTLLAQIPEVDVEAEMALKEERDAKALEKFQANLDAQANQTGTPADQGGQTAGGGQGGQFQKGQAQ